MGHDKSYDNHIQGDYKADSVSLGCSDDVV